MKTHAYRLLHVHGQRLILCLLCNRYSAHPDDIAEHFCGHCRIWLDYVPEDYSPHPVGPLGPPRLAAPPHRRAPHRR